MSEEYVATDTDDTDFLGSILCKSPVDENSCNDNSRDCDSILRSTEEAVRGAYYGPGPQLPTKCFLVLLLYYFFTINEFL